MVWYMAKKARSSRLITSAICKYFKKFTAFTSCFLLMILSEMLIKKRLAILLISVHKQREKYSKSGKRDYHGDLRSTDFLNSKCNWMRLSHAYGRRSTGVLGVLPLANLAFTSPSR